MFIFAIEFYNIKPIRLCGYLVNVVVIAMIRVGHGGFATPVVIVFVHPV
jgi:hypothetical protein